MSYESRERKLRERLQARTDEIFKRLPAEGPLVGAEIGINLAKMSLYMLNREPRLYLYMVDSWRLEGRYLYTVDHIKPFRDRTLILRTTSLHAAPLIEDGSLDFAFIDADHSKEAVEADIAAWSPKIKPGGWLCGHDYGKPTHGVKKAVDKLKGVELGADWTWFKWMP